MTYEVESAGDGIVIRNIPDNIAPNDPRIRAKVMKARAERDSQSVLAEMSGTEKALAGVGMGMSRVARGAGQLLGLTKQETVDEAAPRDAALAGTTEGLTGDIIGNLAVTALPGAGLGGLAMKGATAALPAILAPAASTVGSAATGAALSAGTTPIATGESRASAAGMGAVGGAAGDVAVRVAARAAHPIMQSDAVKKLLSEGIVPTPGQAIGARTLAGTTEQKVESLPLVGQIIQNAKQRGVGELNLAQLKRSVPVEDAAKVTSIGRAGIQQADQVLSQGYQDVLDTIGKVAQPFMLPAQAATRGAFNPQTGGFPRVPALPERPSAIVTKIANDPDLALTDEAKAKLLNFVKMQFSRPGIDKATGEMTADLAKQIDSTLGRVARERSASAIADDRSLGLALRAVQGEWRDALRQAAPDAATGERLDALNKAYANFVRTERAGAAVGAKEGVFSPAQLQNAVKSSDASVRKKGFAEGRALGQDLSDPASAVLGNVVGDSGTAGRTLMDMVMLKGGAAHLANPAMYGALAVSPFLYSRAGSRYMLGDLIPGQSPLAEAIRSTAPLAAQAGRAYADRPK